mmetsp:Transcript_21862/g.51887  ORF Transcript_21862/g.51887 Transcript_21862/m.51887 type:complete len:348 (+) Transcript_21862:664-1707(+)
MEPAAPRRRGAVGGRMPGEAESAAALEPVRQQGARPGPGQPRRALLRALSQTHPPHPRWVLDLALAHASLAWSRRARARRHLNAAALRPLGQPPRPVRRRAARAPAPPPLGAHALGPVHQPTQRLAPAHLGRRRAVLAPHISQHQRLAALQLRRSAGSASRTARSSQRAVRAALGCSGPHTHATARGGAGVRGVFAADTAHDGGLRARRRRARDAAAAAPAPELGAESLGLELQLDRRRRRRRPGRGARQRRAAGAALPRAAQQRDPRTGGDGAGGGAARRRSRAAGASASGRGVERARTVWSAEPGGGPGRGPRGDAEPRVHEPRRWLPLAAEAPRAVARGSGAGP